MYRFLVTFFLSTLSICSVGCQLSPTLHDNRIAGFVDRPNDYRGFNPFYRAGSVLSNTESGTHLAATGDLYNNAGDYGVTSPTATYPHPDSRNFEPSPIGIPHPGPDGDVPDVFTPDSPTIRELLDRPRGTVPTMPGMLPNSQTTLPIIPRTAPLPHETLQESMPLVPGDMIETSPNGFPMMPLPPTPPNIHETELPFTLEDLRRLDPSVQDLQIISIEDSAARR